MAPAVTWKFANAEAVKQFPTGEIGSPSIKPAPVSVTLASNLSFGGDARKTPSFAINPHAELSIAVLNDPTDVDEDGVLAANAAKTADGDLPPQLAFSDNTAYLKYRVEAGVKAAGEVPVSALLGIEAGAEGQVVFADYRVHPPVDKVRTALAADLKAGARFVSNVDDVVGLGIGEALAFRRAGSLSLAVTVSWSDVFVGQVGTLSKLLGGTKPIAMSTKAGASLGFNIKVTDDFMVAISRVDEKRWRVGVRKVKSNRAGVSADAGIDVGLADPASVRALARAALEGVLGAPLADVKAALDAASLEALDGAKRKVAKAVMDRLGLDQAETAIEALRDRVAALESRIDGVIEKMLETRIALSVAYEYNRITSATNVLQAVLSESAVTTFHEDLVAGRTASLAAGIAAGRPGLMLETYLNQRELTRTQTWGFTLGFGKWARLGGSDFKQVSRIVKTDIAGRVQESYLCARSYEGSWVGEGFKWGVDLKADMKEYAREPLVSDYSFGIHLLWLNDQKSLSGDDLEQWLDSAVIWRVAREVDLVDLRARLAGAVNRPARLSVQVVIPNTAILSMLPSLAAAPIEAYASALAKGMPWMSTSPARSSAGAREAVYTPLWTTFIRSPHLTQSELARSASRHVIAEGHAGLQMIELQAGNNPFSFAGLTRLNGDTVGACGKFTRGAQILSESIGNGRRNQKTIDKAVGEMNDLWSKSHHVRAIGVYLLDAAAGTGVLDTVTRTMTVESQAFEGTVVVTA